MRILPFSIAGVFCFCIAAALGTGLWYLFGTNRRLTPEKTTLPVQSSNVNTSAAETANLSTNQSNSATTANIVAPAPEIKKAPAGEVAIGGGEVTLGGGETELPVRRVAVESFSIAETEVTNAQYAEFIEDTKRKAPAGWRKDKFRDGTGDQPVANVSWADANAYCEWLSKKLDATVRLPSEAEWQMAARGTTDLTYPWGNDWDNAAAESGKSDRRPRSVKSFPKGRAASGAYDLVGNVWEWTSDEAVDAAGSPILYENMKQRVIKGGSVYDNRKLLTVEARLARPEEKPSDVLGFRYVIIRK